MVMEIIYFDMEDFLQGLLGMTHEELDAPRLLYFTLTYTFSLVA